MTLQPCQISVGVFHLTLAGILSWIGLAISAVDGFGEEKRSPVKTELAGDGRRAFVRSIGDNPVWKLEGVEYALAPAFLKSFDGDPNRCSIAIYLRNKSNSAATVKSIALDGIAADELVVSKRIAWWRAWPETVQPGGMTQILVRFLNVGEIREKQMSQGLPGIPFALDVRTAGQSVETKIAFAIRPRPVPIRINFIAFDDKLQALHVYVAMDSVISMRQIDKVEVNGTDVTDRVQPSLANTTAQNSGIIPLRIELKAPLTLAAPVVVNVHSGQLSTGHAVRAFPSRFPIQVVVLGDYPETDDIDRIADLGFTDVGFCGPGAKYPQYLEAMKRRDLKLFPYTGSKIVEKLFHGSDMPPISGWWFDEVDDPIHPVPQGFQKSLMAGDRLLQQRNVAPSPYCANICSPTLDRGYVELVDALNHEYGIDLGLRKRLPQVNLKNPNDVAFRELRIARRPWWPYFRNIEAVLLLDPNTKEIVKSFRPIDPQEHRLMVYSCLANGAKGALHWNYGVMHLNRDKWFSDKHEAIRLNMTALRGNRAFGKEIPKNLLEGLRTAMVECGRVNVELQLLGPLLAIGDVSSLAKVRKSEPAKNPKGGPSVHAKAIVCGLDTIVLLVVNLNIDSEFNARNGTHVKSYEPAAADVDVSVPSWMPTNADVFQISWDGVSPLSPNREKNAWSFHIPCLKVSKAIVITSNNCLQQQMKDHVTLLGKRLGNAEASLLENNSNKNASHP